MTEFWERNLILRVVAGSRAHGLDREGSDEDTRGVTARSPLPAEPDSAGAHALLVEMQERYLFESRA